MDQVKKVGVVGSGTMGAGIVQLMVQNGYAAVMFDIDQDTVEKAKAGIESRLDRLVEKKKVSAAEMNLTLRKYKE